MRNKIFLDIDGCLVSYTRFERKKVVIDGVEFHNPVPLSQSISALNSIASFMDADIVVTSSWRDSCGFKELDAYFKYYGMSADIVACTEPVLSDTYFFTRGEEIVHYIDGLSELPSMVLIIEDTPESLYPFVSEQDFPGECYSSRNVLVTNRYRCLDEYDAEYVFKQVISTRYDAARHAELLSTAKNK